MMTVTVSMEDPTRFKLKMIITTERTTVFEEEERNDIHQRISFVYL